MSFGANRPFVWMTALATGLAGSLAVSPAFAQQTLGDMTNNLYNSMTSLQYFLSMLSYVVGTYFVVTGLQMLKAYVDDPGRNPLNVLLLRMCGGAFFIFVPTMVNLVITTIAGDGPVDAVNDTAVNFNAVAGAGVDGALTRFIMDVSGPFIDNILPLFCYITGVVMLLMGLKRMALANGDGPQAPTGLGTAGTFVVAAMLLSFGYVISTLQMSIFGSDTVFYAQLAESTGNTQMDARFNTALWSIFVFLRIVGYISILRGLFMLKGAADGANVSMMAVATHMVAGAMLANGGMFVEAVQGSFMDGASRVLVRT